MLEGMRTQDIVDHFYKPGVGSATYALKQIRYLLEHEIDDPPQKLVERVDMALDQYNTASGYRFDWDNHQKLMPLRRQGAAEADARVDRAVTTVHESAQRFEEFDESSEYYQLAVEFNDALFPEGVYPITSVRYEEQHNKVNELLRRMRGPFSEHVDKLLLTLHVDRLEELNKDYGEKLTSRNNTGVSFDQVDSAEEQATELYFEVIVLTWAFYIDDAAMRNKVLSPIEEQNQRIARHYQRRGHAPTVDPETGEVIDPDEPTGDVEPDFDDSDQPQEEDTQDPVADPIEPAE